MDMINLSYFKYSKRKSKAIHDKVDLPEKKRRQRVNGFVSLQHFKHNKHNNKDKVLVIKIQKKLI